MQPSAYKSAVGRSRFNSGWNPLVATAGQSGNKELNRAKTKIVQACSMHIKVYQSKYKKVQ